MHDRKADTILKMTLFYQDNNMAKDSMQSASLSLEEKTHMILNNKRRSALRRHPDNANIKLKQFWENTNKDTEKRRRHKIHEGQTR